MRGTAQQLFEKYLQLGRDATSGGDRVMAESYFQHAEHYFRILNAMSQAHQPPSGPQPRQQRQQHNGPEMADPAAAMMGNPEGTGDQPELNGHAAAANGHALPEVEAEEGAARDGRGEQQPS